MSDKSSVTLPFVSVIMPCRNEKAYIARAIDSLLKTSYPRARFEIIIVDGESNDGTKDIIILYAQSNSTVKILENKRKIVPSAMNIGIKAARGDIIIRVDAHSEYPDNYINKCVEHLEKTGAWCVGGPFYNKSSGSSFMARIIAATLSYPFLVGNSKFRTKQEPIYVETVPFGAFYKDVFKKVGLYDERLTRHQDYELCKRIIKHGGKIFMTPEIKNFYYPRSNLFDFLKMAVDNGFWDSISIFLCPHTFAWRHFIPGPFFLGSCFCLLFLVAGFFMHGLLFFLGICGLLLYFLPAFLSSLSICRRHKLGLRAFFVIPFVCFLFHFCFGFGVVKGWGKVLIFILKGKKKKIA